VYENIIPLASGYLQKAAQVDSEISEKFTFSIHSQVATANLDDIVDDLIAAASDVYAFSCYVWNGKRVKDVLEKLIKRRPDAHFILGGPQVMNHAHEYIPANSSNVVVCNGEGERTFVHYLTQVLREAPDFSAVPGLTYWNDGGLKTTTAAPRIADLSDLPSPFTDELFGSRKYTQAILETNRGCPFSCGFCFWGAATNAKVHRFETDRIKDDITWISKNGFVSLYIADANWGMTPRDIELTKHIIECKEKNGYPLMVAIQSAKNKPERVAEITQLLAAGGLMTAQPISLQTTTVESLQLVDRQNIRQDSYTKLQEDLKQKNISSYVELIWPLPGETYQSFKKVVDGLCHSGADTIIIYPQLLLRNTPIAERRAVYEIETERPPGDIAEADIVVRTKWADRAEVLQGAWFYYSILISYDLRALYYTSKYLAERSSHSYADLFEAFARYLASKSDSSFCRFLHDSVDGWKIYDFLNAGHVAHDVLYAKRDQVNDLLSEFAQSQEWWSDSTARACFELDILARPFIYRGTVRSARIELAELMLVENSADAFSVRIPAALADLLTRDGVASPLSSTSGDSPSVLHVHHASGSKLRYQPKRSLEHNASYCQAMVERVRELVPVLTLTPAVDDKYELGVPH
jgi:putative methyltransferase